jgi:predicted small lipoprotein YifL
VRRVLVAMMAAAALSGCGSKPPPEPAKVEAPVEVAPSRPKMAVESEIGALNEEKVNQAFKKAAKPLGACFDKGTERLPYLSGEVRFVVRVTKMGDVRWAFVKDSTLGDRETEECMLGALKTMSWPKPEGGEGLAENSFTFEPGDGERPPVAWSADQLGAPFKRVKPALAKCRKSAGTGALKATLYVDTDGKPAAVGVSGADERGEAAVACVVSTLQRITFPSPGSYASKVSVTIE